MFNIGDNVIYMRDLCTIIDIKDNNTAETKNYILQPVYDKSLTISIPVNNTNKFLRPVISKKEALSIIKKIPEIQVIDLNDRLIESEYKTLMKSNTFEGLIKIIKTTHIRNAEKESLNKKGGNIDKDYNDRAEKYLYREFSVALNMTYVDVKEYVISEVNKLLSKKAG